MSNRPPPLQTLRAFEATGRLLSMTEAAVELHVTAGAISRQVRALEDDLGVPLFHRLIRQIVLTEAGASFHATVSRALADIARDADLLRVRTGNDRLTISTSVSFAAKWFAPRLHRLAARLPDVDIHLEVSDVNIDLSDGRVDATIRYGVGSYPQTVSERILDETMCPVCSPRYRDEKRIDAPSNLLGCTLLNEERLLHDDSTLPKWSLWLEAAGMSAPRMRGPTFSHGSLVIEAAIRGEGVALGRSALVAEDLTAGRLVEPFPDIRLPAGRGYDLVHRSGEENEPTIVTLRDWLREEVRDFLATPEA
ncbi:LysR substrate-binding domain-containing protein [Aureimonas psammosilenae]|uniref:LysR substrate-binding domain-containing protein n=1 Tax=Aureimonas psammosilenae TaxID=2495496 RepID=UPI0012612C40|nr:LysR substrate-binding domain-containing protein [Aureimonas psammosilenae]